MGTTTTTKQGVDLEHLQPRGSAGELVVPADARSMMEELLERESRTPSTISAITVRDVEEAARAAMALQHASIELTYPEDWVLFRAKDGAEVCYLEDVGCQRVRGMWGVTFDRVDLHRDVIEQELDDGHIFVEAMIRAHCAVTGEEMVEMGQRSSAGFFERAWKESEDKPVERARVKSDIRKAALANARGRCIRAITGLGQTPKERLQKAGLDIRRIRGVQFQAGTKGGSGDYASAAQLKKLVGEALRKVAGLEHLELGFDGLMEKLEAASLPKRKASEIIDRLVKAESESVTVAKFEEALGVDLAPAEPGAEG